MLGIKKRYFVGAGLIGALFYGSQHYSISGLNDLRLVPKSESPSLARDPVVKSWDTLSPAIEQSNRSTPIPSPSTSPVPIWPSNGDSKFQSASRSRYVSKSFTESSAYKIRIASFNLHAFNEEKLQKLPVVETLVRMIRQFDVVALQHISSRQNDILPILVERVNMSDRRYDFCIGPRVGRDQKQQFAFVFDTDRIEIDREQLYTVDDPQDLMVYEPLVGWFRTKIPRRDKAFTFTLVNLRLDSLRAEEERRLLPNLLRSIRSDGRLEDDIIVAGEFQSTSQNLQAVAGLNLTMAIDGIPTTVSGEAMSGNILFPPRSTDEFSGRSGVIDFLRQLNLTYDQAMQVSANLPIWAEFDAHEGGSND